MNIFEHLGLPKDHRKNSSKVTQLVKHWDDVTEKNKSDKNFALQTKKDGVCSIVIVKGNSVTIWSRTGKQFTNTEKLVERLKYLYLPDGAYFGEMLLPKSVASLETVSGMVNPNRAIPLGATRMKLANALEMWFFDLVSLDSFVIGSSITPFYKRFSTLRERLSGKLDHYVHLCEAELAFDKDYIDARFEKEVDSGEEGIIIRDNAADWEAGHKGYRVMKMVRSIDYDLLCVGYETGTGKYEGKIANLVFKWKNGGLIECMLGKGWTHQDAEDMFLAIKGGSDTPIGKIFQVYALEESSKGKLRLPKVGEFRHDKVSPDV